MPAPAPPSSASSGDGHLLALWRRRIHVTGDHLAVGELQHREIANAGAAVGADYQGRFLIELLQNASDQATRARLGRRRLDDARVLVARAPGLVAVLNQGRPMTRIGLERITSLAISDKNPAVCLGNKGVGFKSVFRVSQAPEIYGLAGPHGLAAGAPLHFALDLGVFRTPEGEALVRRLVAEVLAEDPALARRLAPAGQDPAERLLTEVTRWAPPWKFPLPLAVERLRERAAALDVVADLERFTTMVVLPIAPEKEADVEGPVQELLDQGAGAMLFLPAVSEIEVRDLVRGRTTVLARRVTPLRTLGRGTRLERVETERREDGRPVEALAWWRLRRVLGLGCTPEGRAERAAVREAVKQLDLPGTGWQRVRTADVAVALPMPAAAGEAPPQPEGRFCIGLPTNLFTGTSFWVDGRFHGNVARTEVSFAHQYNRLLLEEAVALLGLAFQELRAGKSPEERAWLTLLLGLGTGELANQLMAPGGLARGPVVLDAAGQGHVEAASLRLPARQHLAELERLGLDDEALRHHGFVLPHRDILARGWEILLGLGVIPGPEREPRLAEGVGGASLLELAAARRRHDGPAFWEPFLRWVLAAVPDGERLLAQRILPVGEDGLARASDLVFIAPYQGADDAQGEADELEPEGIPELVQRALRFLDGRAVMVRQEGKRLLTPLAVGLEQRKLVSRPRIEDLIRGALAPRLAEAAADPDQAATAVALLHQALTWLRRKRAPKLDSSLLLVPVTDEEEPGAWCWRPPGEVYFSAAWLDDSRAELLTAALGRRPVARLVPWQALALHSRGEEQSWWQARFQELGVAELPRLLRVEPVRRFVARQYRALTLTDTSCPFPAQMAPLWAEYLAAAANREARHKNGHQYELVDECFVDGLEDAETRAAVVRLILENADQYRAACQTFTRRHDETDALPFPAFWVWALRQADWEVFPCADIAGQRLVAAGSAWLLEEHARGHGPRLLPTVTLPSPTALRRPTTRELLGELGVTTVAAAGLDRLVAGLHAVAALPEPVRREHRRAALALASSLWDQLQRVVEPSSDLSALIQAPIPLEVGDELEPVDAAAVARIYLDDDPVRARFVSGFDQAPHLPVGDTGLDRLVAALRKALGEARVQLTSKAAIEVGFTPAEGLASTPFLELVDEHWPTGRVEVAALAAYGATAAAVPGQAAFKERWARFEQLEVVFGTFSSGHLAFYDQERSRLLVALQLEAEPDKVVAAAWQVAGEGFRHAFAAFAAALREGSTKAFFRDQRVNAARFHQVELAIGFGRAAFFSGLRSVLSAVWRRSHPAAQAAAFEDGLEGACETDQQLAAWLGQPQLAAALGQALLAGPEDGAVALLAAAGLEVEDWQAHRALLGEPPWKFERTRRAHAEARALLVAALRTDASRREGLILEAIGALIEQLPTQPAEERLVALVDAADWTRELAGQAAAALPEDEKVHHLRRALAELAEGPGTHQAVVDWAGSKNDLEDYLREMEPLRTRAAGQVATAVLEVAAALAPHRGEALDLEACRANPRVAAFSAGPFASQHAVLRVLADLLREVAPRTAAALTTERVFHRPQAKQDLWARFPELGLSAPPKPVEKPVEAFDGQHTMDALTQDLAAGSTGKLGHQLQASVDPSLDLAALRGRAREQVPVRRRLPRRPGTGTGGGGARRKPSDAELRLNGDLGEAFVYEQLRAQLPDFTHLNWFSEARGRYGISEGEGQDHHGFDFRYVDVEGTLGGLKGAICLIEVKATSGDGDEPFPISINEWERATQAHQAPDGTEPPEVYLIVRVAHVRSAPRIVDVLVDPVRLRAEGKLRLDESALVAVAG